jgi:hypothetical protein
MTDGLMDGWTDGRTDERTNFLSFTSFFNFKFLENFITFLANVDSNLRRFELRSILTNVVRTNVVRTNVVQKNVAPPKITLPLLPVSYWNQFVSVPN